MKLKNAVQQLVRDFGTKAEQKHAVEIANAFVRISGSYDIHPDRFQMAEKVGRAVKQITGE